MRCQQCECVTEINGEYFTDCEVYGKCFLGDEVLECPEEQLEEFKGD